MNEPFEKFVVTSNGDSAVDFTVRVSRCEEIRNLESIGPNTIESAQAWINRKRTETVLFLDDAIREKLERVKAEGV